MRSGMEGESSRNLSRPEWKWKRKEGKDGQTRRMHMSTRNAHMAFVLATNTLLLPHPTSLNRAYQ